MFVPNLADLLRAELLNYELAIQLAESKIAYFSSRMERDKGLPMAKTKSRFVYAKIAKERWETFRDDVLEIKKSLAQGIDSALAAYPALHRQIFSLYFLEQASIDECAAKTGLTSRQVKAIVEKINGDLHELYRP